MFDSEDLFARAVNAGKARMQGVLLTVDCPEHGKKASNVRWEAGDALAFDACCETHKSAVLEAIQG